MKILLDSSLDFSDSLPPLLVVGDRRGAEEILDHEVCHPGDARCKKQCILFDDYVAR